MSTLCHILYCGGCVTSGYLQIAFRQSLACVRPRYQVRQYSPKKHPASTAGPYKAKSSLPPITQHTCSGQALPVALSSICPPLMSAQIAQIVVLTLNGPPDREPCMLNTMLSAATPQAQDGSQLRTPPSRDAHIHQWITATIAGRSTTFAQHRYGSSSMRLSAGAAWTNTCSQAMASISKTW
jgi:hypothetical protein